VHSTLSLCSLFLLNYLAFQSSCKKVQEQIKGVIPGCSTELRGLSEDFLSCSTPNFSCLEKSSPGLYFGLNRSLKLQRIFATERKKLSFDNTKTQSVKIEKKEIKDSNKNWSSNKLLASFIFAWWQETLYCRNIFISASPLSHAKTHSVNVAAAIMSAHLLISREWLNLGNDVPIKLFERC